VTVSLQFLHVALARYNKLDAGGKVRVLDVTEKFYKNLSLNTNLNDLMKIIFYNFHYTENDRKR